MSTIYKYYWCVKVTEDISKSGEIFLHSDRIIVENDDLYFFCDKGYPLLIIPKRYWKLVYAASVIDGHAVCIERWEEVILDEKKA